MFRKKAGPRAGLFNVEWSSIVVGHPDAAGGDGGADGLGLVGAVDAVERAAEIHPETIGTAVSSGCIRMTNDDVMDLYTRAKVGTKVIEETAVPMVSGSLEPWMR
jgi:hypothetical protein